jgi:hypothetical protein
MYNSKEAFIKDVQKIGAKYYSDASLQPQKIAVAYAIYQKAREGSILDISVVGRWQLKKKGEDKQFILIPSDENFPSIDEAMRNNLLTIDEDFTKESGSILDSGNWSLLANDAWLIGGIHAKTEFHFASPLRWTNLWDDDSKRMTVTAREVIGIISLGYKIIRPNPKLEAVAVCIDENKATTASLLIYQEKVQMHSTYGALRRFFRSLPNSVTK